MENLSTGEPIVLRWEIEHFSIRESFQFKSIKSPVNPKMRFSIDVYPKEMDHDSAADCTLIQIFATSTDQEIDEAQCRFALINSCGQKCQFRGIFLIVYFLRILTPTNKIYFRRKNFSPNRRSCRFCSNQIWTPLSAGPSKWFAAWWFIENTLWILSYG